jgi:hypothetical protein
VKPKQTEKIQNLINFLSTQDLEAVITGENFMNLDEIKIILRNKEATYDITSIANAKLVLNNIEFISPSIDKLKINYEIRYPLELELGLSFNSGFEYKYFPFIYENSCLFLTF